MGFVYSGPTKSLGSGKSWYQSVRPMPACDWGRLMKSQYVALSMSLMLASMPTAVRSFCTAWASLGNGSTLWP